MRGIAVMPSITSFAVVPAIAAAASLLATPAQGAEFPSAPALAAIDAAPLWSPADDSAANHRRYRYRRGSDVGDVLTGILIVGGIAAIADAASRKARDDRYRDSDWRYPDPRREDDWRYRSDRRDDYDDSRGLDSAVQMCVDAVERDNRVETVTNADRTASGWTVSGALAGGRSWRCSIGADGRIESLDTDGTAVPYRSGDADDDRTYIPSAADDRQWDDERYAEERARVDAQGYDNPTYSAEADAGPQPDFPGGPVAGEDEDTRPEFEEGDAYTGAGEGT